MNEKISAAVQDWWAFLAFAIGSAGAFWLGTKRREWQLQQAVKDIEVLENRMRDLEVAQRSEAVTIGELAATMKSIATTQDRILAAISALQTGKVDK